ncbi:MAG: CRTAC1 family protein [Pyrinomonadaceae bacterium]
MFHLAGKNIYSKTISVWCSLMLLAPLCFGQLVGKETAFTTFTDVTKAAGLNALTIYGGVEKKRFIIETNGCGFAFLDYDNDGWQDIFTLNGSRLENFPKGQEPINHLYRNNRDGTFTDVTKQAGLARGGWANAVTVGDYDNDGDADLFITYWGQNALYRNNGDGTFTDATARAKLLANGTRWGSGCTFLDYDRDGKLDLFVANYLKFDLATTPEPGKGANCLWKGVPVNCGPKGLPTETNLLYRNNGDGTFTDIAERSGIVKVTGRYAMTAIVTDFDDDGWSDIYVACDSTASILYRNNHDGTFTDVALETGVAYSEDGNAQAGMGLAVGDYNADGYVDIFKTHFSDDLPALYRNTGRGLFDDASRLAGFDHTKYVQWGTGMFDFDNDGWADIFTVTGNVYPEVEKVFKEYPHRTPRLVYRNTGKGKFTDVSAQVGTLAPQSSRGAAFGDFDNDGDTDVLIMNMNDAPTLLRNDNRQTHNWLTVKLAGTKSNRSAIGSRVRVIAAAHTQTQELTGQSSYYSHNDARLHFGLGAANKIDRIEVRWPTGAIELFTGISVNQFATLKEGGGVAVPGLESPVKVKSN